jgi:hypothetical protein
MVEMISDTHKMILYLEQVRISAGRRMFCCTNRQIVQ